MEVEYDADKHKCRNEEDVVFVQQVSTILLAGALLTAPSADSARTPILHTGDRLSIVYAYASQFAVTASPAEVTDVAARFRIVVTGPSAVSVHLTYGGKTRVVAAELHRDGTLVTSTRILRDLLPQYNAIPLMLVGAGESGKMWSAVIPVKVSETEWRGVPVRIERGVRDGRTYFNAFGKKSLLVFTHGFTVAEDVTVKGQSMFDHQNFRNAHYEVHEVVHALKDMRLSYEWTMSPQP